MVNVFNLVSVCAVINIVREVDKLWLSALLSYRSAMVTRMSEEIVRKPRNVLIKPDALHEALRARKSLGQWLK